MLRQAILGLDSHLSAVVTQQDCVMMTPEVAYGLSDCCCPWCHSSEYSTRVCKECVCVHQVASSPEDQAIQEAIETGDAILQRLYQPGQDALWQRTASAASEAHSSWVINTAGYCVAPS